MDNIKQYIKNINFILKNIDNKRIDSKFNIKNENGNNNISIKKTIKSEKTDRKKEEGYMPIMEKGSKQVEELKSNLQENNKNKKINKVKNNKDKRIFDDTNVDIKGEYHKIEYISKIKKKKLTGYSFSYSENDFITKFIFKNNSTNREFYTCFKKGKGCEAKAYFEKKKLHFTYIKDVIFL